MIYVIIARGKAAKSTTVAISLCEGLYCDDALDAFLDENQGFFDDDAE